MTSTRALKKAVPLIISTIQSIPENEGVILFTYGYLHRSGEANQRQFIVSAMQEAGIDPTAKIRVNRKSLNRFVWLTWGQETNLNVASYCQNIILAGILNLKDNDVAAMICGQSDNLLINIFDLREWAYRGERAYLIYQVLNRSNGRDTVHGKAGSMNGWITCDDPIVGQEVQKVIPGVRWEAWRSEEAGCPILRRATTCKGCRTT